MDVFFSTRQLAHRPSQFMVAGRIVPPFEVPERAERMAARLSEAGFQTVEPVDRGFEAIHAVHPDHYTAFLATAHDEFQSLANAGPEAWPNVHPHLSGTPDGAPRPAPRATSPVARTGWYVGDMACAIGPGTWSAVYASAQAAINAAEAVVAGADQAMALCRPPGHHAYHDRASGFCFLNNAAIAAEVLRRRFAKVAILDFDTHHGDGTQAIFFRRDDVFVGSSHTDPANYYPFYCGYPEETGYGAGSGTNLNVPLPPGAGDDAFCDASEKLRLDALAFGAEALVISAGWDAHRSDPLSKLDVSTQAYAALGRLYGEIPLPTVIVQEGGYALAAIEEIAPLFLAEYMVERKPE